MPPRRLLVIGPDDPVQGLPISSLIVSSGPFSVEEVHWCNLSNERILYSQAHLILAVATPSLSPAMHFFTSLRTHPLSKPRLAILPVDAEVDALRTTADAVDDFLLWPSHPREFDDWSAPHRLSLQVRAPTENPSIGLGGLASIFFVDPLRRQAWMYQHPHEQRSCVAAGTMGYRKEFWSHIHFPDVAEGEDTRFAWADRGSRILPLKDPSIYVATVHPRNSSPKHTSDSRCRSCRLDSIRDLLGEDWAFYLNWARLGAEEATNGAAANVGFPDEDIRSREVGRENLGGRIPVNVSRGAPTC